MSTSGRPGRRAKASKPTARPMRRKFTVVIERDPGGGYVASVAELPGCHTQGETLRELRANAKEAIALYLEGSDPSQPLPEFVKVETVEV